MKNFKKLYHPILLMGFCVFVAQGCASMGSSISANERTYSQSFDKAKEMIQQGIQKTNLGILDIDSEENKVTYYVVRQVSINNRDRHQEQGKVIVTATKSGKTHVEVENPEYHYTVPRYEREDYRRRLFNVFDKMLGKESTSQVTPG